MCWRTAKLWVEFRYLILECGCLRLHTLMHAVIRIGSNDLVFECLIMTYALLWSCDSGILYESCNQPRDAYACYVNATRGGSLSPGGPVSPNNNSVNSNGGATLVVTSTPGGRVPGGMNPNLEQRIKFLQSHLANPPMPSVTSKWVLIKFSSSSQNRHTEALDLCMAP